MSVFPGRPVGYWLEHPPLSQWHHPAVQVPLRLHAFRQWFRGMPWEQLGRVALRWNAYFLQKAAAASPGGSVQSAPEKPRGQSHLAYTGSQGLRTRDLSA